MRASALACLSESKGNPVKSVIRTAVSAYLFPPVLTCENCLVLTLVCVDKQGLLEENFSDGDDSVRPEQGECSC